MGIPDGAHTHGSSGSGLGPVVLVVLAVALAGPAIAAAAVELLHILVIAAAAIGGLVLAGGAALVAVRVHHRRAGGVTPVSSFPAPPPWRPVAAPRAPRQVTGQPVPAIEHHHHVHFHGVAAEDVAAIIGRQQGN